MFGTAVVLTATAWDPNPSKTSIIFDRFKNGGGGGGGAAAEGERHAGDRNVQR